MPEALTSSSYLQDAVTAAAVQITSRNALALKKTDSKSVAWQDAAYEYYRTLGEVRFIADFRARNMSKLRLFVERRVIEKEDDPTTGEAREVEKWVEVREGPAFDLFEQIKDPSGGHRRLLRSYELNYFLAGEGMLLASINQDATEPVYEFVSRFELAIEDTAQGQKIKRKGFPVEGNDHEYDLLGADGNLAPGAAVAYRFWRPDPKLSSQADSPMRSVQRVAQLILDIEQQMGHANNMRLSNGILVASDKMTAAPVALPGMDEDGSVDPVLRDLFDAVSSVKRDPGDPTSLMPILVRTPGKVAEALMHLNLIGEDRIASDLAALDLLIRRLALGLDTPPEQLLGQADSNHFSSYQIDEATYKVFLEPDAMAFTEDLYAQVLAPNLDNPGDWRIGFDPTAIIERIDKTDDVLELWDRALVGDRTTRRILGFTEDDAMNDDDFEQWLIIQGKTAGGPGLDEEDDPDAGSEPPDTEDDAREGDDPDDVQDAPVQASALIGELRGAVNIGLARAREQAGAKLRARMQGKQEWAKHDQAPKRTLAAEVGREAAVALGYSAGELVDGSLEIVRDALYTMLPGVNEDGIERFIKIVYAHAEASLWDTAKPGTDLDRYIEALAHAQWRSAK